MINNKSLLQWVLQVTFCRDSK